VEPGNGEQPGVRGWPVFLAAVLLCLPHLLFPVLWFDDFAYLRDSWTWALARRNLWVPFNDHAMPLARLSTWLLASLAGNASALPWVLGLQGPLALWLGMGLLYLFLRRELGSRRQALVGTALFGVCTQYFEAVWWYSATFALLALDTFLLALLAAQRYRQTGRRAWLLGCALGCALAPGWYAGGVLAGPLCALYLLGPEPARSRAEGPPRRRWLGALGSAAVPLLGTGAFLAVSLPHTARAILHAGHYGGESAWQAFNLPVGLLHGGRALVDNLFFGSLGIPFVCCPLWLAVPLMALLVGAGVVWYVKGPERRLMLLGLGCVSGSYALIYGARWSWGYEQTVGWTRYQVFAQLGLVLFLAAGLPRWEGRLASLRPRAWLLALLALWLTQLPRAWRFPLHYRAEQRAQLRRVDAVDARCRQHRISAAQACAALEPLTMAGGSEEDNAWNLLRGSSDPRPVEPAEVRHFLAP
jgi:hypothetical protein